MEFAEKRGRAEGLEEGLEKGKTEMARKLKESGFMTLEQIALVSGLPIGDVERL
jgi:predicted transposase YdaD